MEIANLMIPLIAYSSRVMLKGIYVENWQQNVRPVVVIKGVGKEFAEIRCRPLMTCVLYVIYLGIRGDLVVSMRWP